MPIMNDWLTKQRFAVGLHLDAKNLKLRPPIDGFFKICTGS